MLTGLNAAYMIRQTQLFKQDLRKDYATVMNVFAKGMTDQDMREAAEYFAAQKPEVFYKVVEVTAAPRSYVDDKFMRLPRPDSGTEPLGKQIIALPAGSRAHRSTRPALRLHRLRPQRKSEKRRRTG
jgi:hypothetical protein